MSDDDTLWMSTYYVPGELPWQDENFNVPLSIGDGFLDANSGYRRFRVVDIWYSTDHHGVFDIGRHVFLEDVSKTEDDRLFNMEPQYFSRT